MEGGVRLRGLLAIGLILVVAATLCRAQGGPPFVTDDPGTPGNRNWEINLGWVANHGRGGAAYQAPDLDINYGLGNRIQLKYEVALAVATDGNKTTVAGLGESFPGVKIRLYEHHRAGEPKSDENMTFSLGTYPQVLINNPTASVRRGVVETGPQYYLPLEATTKWGPIALNGEVGRWIGNRHVPERWGKGLIAGHAFSDRFELYGEIYDLRDLTSVDGAARQRVFTLDVGGRRTLDRGGHVRLLFMGGRALQHATADNAEPNWMGYIGLQILFGPKGDTP